MEWNLQIENEQNEKGAYDPGNEDGFTSNKRGFFQVKQTSINIQHWSQGKFLTFWIFLPFCILGNSEILFS